MDSNSRRSTLPGASGRFDSFRSKAWTPGEFIGADHPFPPLSHLWSVSVQGADVLSLLVEVLLVDRCEPVPDQVGLEIPLLSRRAACLGEIRSMMPRVTISSAISRALHWLM